MHAQPIMTRARRDARAPMPATPRPAPPADPGVPPAPWRACSTCRRPSPPTSFSSPRESVCRNCRRLSQAAYRRSDRGAATIAAYRAREDVKAARSAAGRRRRAEDPSGVRTAARKYVGSPRGKLGKAAANLRYDLRREADPDRRATILAGLLAIGTQLERMAARRDGRAFDAGKVDAMGYVRRGRG